MSFSGAVIPFFENADNLVFCQGGLGSQVGGSRGDTDPNNIPSSWLYLSRINCLIKPLLSSTWPLRGCLLCASE